MKLSGVEKRGAFQFSEWNLTYRVGWGHICSAAALIYQYTEDAEILVGDANGQQTVNISSAEEIGQLEEMGWLTIRGRSKIIGVPLMITFYNQLDLVRLHVLAEGEEFAETDYKKFNLSMCQFMDSAELAMYM